MSPVTLPSELALELDLTWNDSLEGRTPQSKPSTLSDVLARHPGVPYTTILTVDQGAAIPMFDFHCRRMLKAMQKLCPNSQQPHFSNLQTSMMWLISYVSRFRAQGAGELQIVPMLLVENEKLVLIIHASDIVNPMSNITIVDVECRGKPRKNPQIKDSAWATQRKPLERARIAGVSETILVGIDNNGFHSLLEGLVTNLFVVAQNLEIWTAPDHLVLPGSLRDCVLAACEELGAQVVYRPIRLADFKDFDSAFLTNARRYLHPIHSIHIPDLDIATGCPRRIDLPNRPASTELIDKLRSVVCRILIQNATRIFPSASNVQNAE